MVVILLGIVSLYLAGLPYTERSSPMLETVLVGSLILSLISAEADYEHDEAVQIRAAL